MKYAIIYGNPVDGFRIVGPFDSHDDALEYAADEDRDWWICELDAPATCLDESEQGGACPHDPDGLHFVGCGCDPEDWDQASEGRMIAVHGEPS